jgi:hypothetical protein
MSKKKSFDARLDELLTGIDLPSDEEIKRQTAIERATETKRNNPHYKEIIAEANRKKAQTAEFRENVKSGIKKKWEDPKYIAKSVEGQIKRMSSLNASGKLLDHNRSEKMRGIVQKTHSKPFTIPEGNFPSITAAAKHLGITDSSLKDRMKGHPEKYYFTDIGPGKAKVPEDNKNCKQVQDENGRIWPSRNTAAAGWSCSPHRITYLTKKLNSGWKYLD